MSITVSLELFLKPDRAESVLQTLTELLPGTPAYDGCVSVDVVRDQDDPAHIALIERWREKAAQQEYMAWRVETGAMASVVENSTAPPKVTYFEELAGV